MQDQDFDNVFKTKLESFEMPPDDASWDAINQKMGKKRWFKRTAYYSTVLIVVGVLSYFFTKENGSNQNQLTDSTQTIPNPTPSSIDAGIITETPNINPAFKSKTTSASSSVSSKNKVDDRDPMEQTTTPLITVKDSIPTTTSNTAKTDTVTAPKVVVVKKKKPVYIIQQDTIVKTDTVQVKKRAK